VVVGGAGDLAQVLPDVLHDGDLLLMMGAGDIGHAAQQIATHGFPQDSIHQDSRHHDNREGHRS
jgi:UDP-N-acetylmuramate--alanine ligase